MFGKCIKFRQSDLEKQHEADSKVRALKFQEQLSNIPMNDDPMKWINSMLDAQLKIEDFIVKSREANHPKVKAWGQISVSAAAISISVASLLASSWTVYQGSQTRDLDERRASAEMALKVATTDPGVTRTNLEALTRGGLLKLNPAQVTELSALRPTQAK